MGITICQVSVAYWLLLLSVIQVLGGMVHWRFGPGTQCKVTPEYSLDIPLGNNQLQEL